MKCDLIWLLFGQIRWNVSFCYAGSLLSNLWFPTNKDKLDVNEYHIGESFACQLELFVSIECTIVWRNVAFGIAKDFSCVWINFWSTIFHGSFRWNLTGFDHFLVKFSQIWFLYHTRAQLSNDRFQTKQPNLMLRIAFENLLLVKWKFLFLLNVRSVRLAEIRPDLPGFYNFSDWEKFEFLLYKSSVFKLTITYASKRI